MNNDNSNEKEKNREKQRFVVISELQSLNEIISACSIWLFRPCRCSYWIIVLWMCADGKFIMPTIRMWDRIEFFYFFSRISFALLPTTNFYRNWRLRYSASIDDCCQLFARVFFISSSFLVVSMAATIETSEIIWQWNILCVWLKVF